MKANLDNSKRSEATKRATKRGDEEREAKAKAKQAGRSTGEGKSRRHTHHHRRSDEERRSKDRARGHRDSNMPTSPGVTQVSNKTGEDRASRKAGRSENKQQDQDKEAKRRAKKGQHTQSRSTKPGVESVTSDSLRNRKERSKKSSGSSSTTRPGAETATMESPGEARIARKKDRHNSKSRKPPPIENNNGGDESDVLVMTATLVDGDKDTEEALPGENQPPNIAQASSTSPAENDEIREEAEKQGFYSKHKGLVWLLACLFLVGIVVAVLFLVVFKSAPDDAITDPIFTVEESPAPSITTSTLAPVSETTRTPSASSIFCSGTDVQVQEDWAVKRYDLSLTSELKVELDVDVWQEALQTNFRELLLPAIAGCNLLSDSRFLRQLQFLDASLIQLILVESFECNGEGKSWICNVNIAFYTGSEVAQEVVIDHIRNSLDLEPLETTLEMQDTFETASVVDILAILPSASPSLIPTALPSVAPSLGPTIFKVTPFPSLGPTPLASAPPSNSPSSAPTSSASGLPTQLPSITPSSAPTIPASSGPTGLPTIATSSGPTGLPSITPSSAPTIATSAVPSTEPSQSPSPGPSQSPSSEPSRSPSLAPVPDPTAPPVQAPPDCACPLCTGFPRALNGPCNFDSECPSTAVCHREGGCDCFCDCGISGTCLHPTGGTCFWNNECVSDNCDYTQDPTPGFGRCS